MVGCHDLKAGDILRCSDCGLEIKVIKSCEESCGDACTDSGGCSDDDFKCCGKSMELESASPEEEEQ
jgi:hypothetical protein